MLYVHMNVIYPYYLQASDKYENYAMVVDRTLELKIGTEAELRSFAWWKFWHFMFEVVGIVSIISFIPLTIFATCNLVLLQANHKNSSQA